MAAPASVDSAIDRDHLPRDIGSAGRHQKRNRRSDIFRRSESSEGNHSRQGIEVRAVEHFGLDPSGGDAVDRDFALREFLGKRLGRADEARLRGAVVDLSAITGDPCQ